MTEEFSVTGELSVYAENSRIGVIHSDPDGRMSFTYSADWVENRNSFPISISLPLNSDAIYKDKAHSFFSNLLPEGIQREHVARKLGISVENDFGLLARLGGECAGALWIGAGVPPFFSEQRSEAISEADLHERLSNPSVYASFVGSVEARLSLAGAQDKLPVFVSEEKLFLPLNWAPSSHILKFPNGDYQGLPANEVLMAQIANTVGVHTAEAKLHQVKDVETCLVSRYDRVETEDGVLRRLHQEDFCQAMGLPSSKKYQQEGGPAFSHCYKLLRDVSTEPAIDCDQLMKWFVLNLLIGNADAHAKNLSLLYHSDGSIRLAPFYDLVSTISYENLSRYMAMETGTVYDPGRIGPRQFDILARECGVRPAWLRNLVLEMAEKVAAVLDNDFNYLSADVFVYRRILPAARKQAKHIRNAFRQAAGKI